MSINKKIKFLKLHWLEKAIEESQPSEDIKFVVISPRAQHKSYLKYLNKLKQEQNDKFKNQILESKIK